MSRARDWVAEAGFDLVVIVGALATFALFALGVWIWLVMGNPI